LLIEVIKDVIWVKKGGSGLKLEGGMKGSNQEGFSGK